ncbi:MAG: phytoene desaturase [Deltaproteobacteria bacterium]|nr:phytoene desaturase [Deltaproteobacteria bacterium]
MAGKKIIVVGAGPGGLTSAMILAKRGFDVTVFEKEAVVGGRNAPIRLDGYTFDTGPTFLMMNFTLKEMFEESGRRAEDYIEVKKLEPMYRLRFPDFDIFPTSNRQHMQQQIADLFPGNEGGYERFLATESKRFELLFPCLQKPYSSLFDLFSPALLRALPHLSLGRSMFGQLGRYFDNDQLKLAFTFQAKYLGMSAWDCPAAFTMVPYIEHGHGIYHVIGGLNAISLAMQKVCEELGVNIRTSTPVKRLIIEAGAIKAVELESGERCSADDYIINADFSHAMLNLCAPGELKKYTQAKFDSMSYSCSIFMMYLGVDKVYDLPHHTIVFAQDYKRNVEEIFNGLKLSSDNSFYVQNASVTDPTLAPEGKSALYILTPVPNNRSGIDWEAEKDRFAEHILDQVVARTELKDLRDHIEVRKVITPANWEQDYNVHLGATFNIGHELLQMMYFRPRNRFEEFSNCYLAGGGTHPGSGLPTIYESARISANMLCKKHGVAFMPPGPLPTKADFQ